MMGAAQKDRENGFAQCVEGAWGTDRLPGLRRTACSVRSTSFITRGRNRKQGMSVFVECVERAWGTEHAHELGRMARFAFNTWANGDNAMTRPNRNSDKSFDTCFHDFMKGGVVKGECGLLQRFD